MNDTQKLSAIAAILNAGDAGVTVGMESETAPIQFPALPTMPPPETYYNGTPTRDAKEAIDRARWGLDVSGVRHQTNAEVIRRRAMLDAWTNVDMKNAAASFADQDLFFIFWMNSRIDTSGDFGVSLNNLKSFWPMTVAEWLDSLPPAGAGGHPSVPGV
jgi:hypothetical protein